MNMVDGLSCLGITVPHEAIAFFRNAVLSRQISSREDDFPHQFSIGIRKIIQRSDVFARDDQDVGWCLGIDISKGKDILILENRCAGTLFSRNVTE